MPAPKPMSSTMSPGSQPAGVGGVGERHRDRGGRRVAGGGEDVGGALLGDAELGARRGDDPRVGLVGDEERARRRRSRPARSRARSAESTMIRTARRNTSGPSISMVPPTSACRRWRSEPSEPRSQPRIRPGPVALLEHDGAGAVAEEDRGGAVLPVDDARHRLGADEQHALHAGAEEPVGGDEAVDEAGARRVEVDGSAGARRAPAGSTLADAGIASSGVQVQSSTRSRSAPVTPARAMARSDGLDGETGGGAADAPLADPGALDDPLVAGVERVLEVDVGDDLVGHRRRPNR